MATQSDVVVRIVPNPPGPGYAQRGAHVGMPTSVDFDANETSVAALRANQERKRREANALQAENDQQAAEVRNAQEARNVAEKETAAKNQDDEENPESPNFRSPNAAVGKLAELSNEAARLAAAFRATVIAASNTRYPDTLATFKAAASRYGNEFKALMSPLKAADQKVHMIENENAGQSQQLSGIAIPGAQAAPAKTSVNVISPTGKLDDGVTAEELRQIGAAEAKALRDRRDQEDAQGFGDEYDNRKDPDDDDKPKVAYQLVKTVYPITTAELAAMANHSFRARNFHAVGGLRWHGTVDYGQTPWHGASGDFGPAASYPGGPAGPAAAPAQPAPSLF